MRAANAETDQAHCEAYARKTSKLKISDFKLMAAVCEAAAFEHKQMADRLNGAARQEELILEAGDLYFSASGEITSLNLKIGVAALATCRAIFVDVRDHAATPALHEKAVEGLAAVDKTINALGNMK
jgi:multidrug resistance efflux pump